MKIKGFGGIFLRLNDVDSLKNWYKETLGISMDDWNGTIVKPDTDNETIFSFFNKENDYLKEPERSEYGTFTWISDPEGRWIEIWEK